MTAGLAGAWRDAGKTVIDLGADFRLKDPAAYQKWYGAEHVNVALLEASGLRSP